jgi:hypothetical protein
MGALKDFDDMVAILKILKTFAALSSDDKALFQKIVTNARRSTIRQYYLDKLDLLMSTEMEDPTLIQASNAAGQQASVDAQAKANAPPGAPPPVGPVDTSKPVDTDLSQENAAKNFHRPG